MNHFRDPGDAAAPMPEAMLVDDLARLRPEPPSAGCRARVAAELAGTPPRVALASSVRPLVWFAERLLWAAGGAVAASVVAGVAPTWSSGTAVPTSAERHPTVAGVPATALVADDRPVDATPADPAAVPSAEPLAEESLAWSDEGVRYLADGFPARIYRHWVLERRPDPSGRESLLPREDVFVVPVSLR